MHHTAPEYRSFVTHRVGHASAFIQPITYVALLIIPGSHFQHDDWLFKACKQWGGLDEGSNHRLRHTPFFKVSPWLHY